MDMSGYLFVVVCESWESSVRRHAGSFRSWFFVRGPPALTDRPNIHREPITGKVLNAIYGHKARVLRVSTTWGGLILKANIVRQSTRWAWALRMPGGH